MQRYASISFGEMDSMTPLEFDIYRSKVVDIIERENKGAEG